MTERRSFESKYAGFKNGHKHSIIFCSPLNFLPPTPLFRNHITPVELCSSLLDERRESQKQNLEKETDKTPLKQNQSNITSFIKHS